MMDRDYVWEADYGNRKDVIEATKILLRELNVKSLQSISYFVNNNPYNFEFYVVTNFDKPTEQEIDDMKNLFKQAGMRHRIDITMDSLMKETANRRFDSTSFCDEFTVDLLVPKIFLFAERKELEEKGYIMKPMFRKDEVFISHSSHDKNEVREIIPYLNGGNHAVWFDEYSIEVGDSLTEKISDGIENATAVILWITKNFMNSSWCMKEKELAKNSGVKVIICVDSEIEKEILPPDILQYKYFVINIKDSPESIAQKILNEVLY